jgi:hypothetical protein
MESELDMVIAMNNAEAAKRDKHMTSLKAELRAIAEEAERRIVGIKNIDAGTINSALHAAVRLVLEREPSEAMIKAGFVNSGAHATATFGSVYSAMTAQLLKELDAP